MGSRDDSAVSNEGRGHAVKASEFIELLKKQIAEHGDFPLCIDGYYGATWGEEVTDVHFEDLRTSPTSTLKADRKQFMIEPALDP